MTQVTLKVNQFAPLNCNHVFDNIKGTLVGKTVSLCQHCHQHIPAHTYHIDNQFWMVKSCRVHGVSHHMIERDYAFLLSLVHNESWYEKNCVLFEVTDKCNVECPHCYHMPDNKMLDNPVEEIISRIKEWYVPNLGLMLAGAEASLHKDLLSLIQRIVQEFDWHDLLIMTNGVRFADKEFLVECKDAGLKGLCIGLNHPSYLDNKTIRRKQIQAIENANDADMMIAYVSYTMSSISELEDILTETTSSNWRPVMYRIRYGSDIGRYPDQARMYLSDIYKATEDWCKRNGKSFERINGDDNIYHVMVRIDGDNYRLIQWCDETDIHMEELRTGPYCDFVHDGITNFLHQVIRRDVLKNKAIPLPDVPPIRYQLAGSSDTSELDFSKLY